MKPTDALSLERKAVSGGRAMNPTPNRTSDPAGAGVIPRRAARVLRFETGTLWQLGAATVSILKPIAVGRLLVRHLIDARTEVVDTTALRPTADGGLTNTAERRTATDDYSDAVWGRAREEERLIGPLLGNSDPKARIKVVQALALSERQIRRKLKRYALLHSIDAFLPLRRGPLPGSTTVHPDVERLMAEEIRAALKLSPDIGVDDLLPLIQDAAETLGLPPPGRSTVSRRLRQARRHTALLPAAIGREIAYRNRPVRSSIETGAPLSVVEIDHTVADVHLIEPQTGASIGRPVLTMMIDRATRVILGMLLSLEAPSQLSIGLCLHHSTFSKDNWLNNLGLSDACWPGFGLASTILSDNGREFHGRAFRRAAEVYGVELRYRPLGHPAAGGIIERAIGTFMTKVRLLPGASFSKLLGKRPRHAIRGARMTLKELELYIARQVSAYHKVRHRTLEMPPILAWERAWRINGTPAVPRLPASADHFLLTFLPGEWRTVSREGIALHALRFRSPDLIPHIEPGRRQMVRYDPRDLSRVFLETPTDYIAAELANGPAMSFSLWEWRELRASELQAGRSRDPHRIAQELAANRSLIREKVSRHHRGSARRLAREAQWFIEPTAVVTKSHFLKSRALPHAARCRVQGDDRW
jgi:putative transposase